MAVYFDTGLPAGTHQEYNITYDGNEYKLTMPNIYSTSAFEEEYTYTGEDLGAQWTSESTRFRVWAPTADAVFLNLYASGTEGTDDLLEQLGMSADANGTWTVEKEGDLNGTYYTYTAVINGEEREACDPYARTTGVNGKRAMVIDLASTNPQGWEADSDPNAGGTYNDAIIYELHVRDLSSDPSSGIENVGKFLGLTETGTQTAGEWPQDWITSRSWELLICTFCRYMIMVPWMKPIWRNLNLTGDMTRSTTMCRRALIPQIPMTEKCG